MTKRERELLRLLEKDPTLEQKELAEALGIQRSSVAVHISNLMKKGVIRGRGYLLVQPMEVLVIGAANVDLVGRSAETFSHGDSNPGMVQMSLGGVGRNIAENLARLGRTVRFLSAVGKDVYGDKILSHLEGIGVNTRSVLQIEGARTSVYLAMTDDRGELVGAINDMGIVDRITPATIGAHRAEIESAEAIVVDANLRRDTLQAIAKIAGHRRIYADAVSDVKCRRLLPLLSSLRMIKPNERELGLLVGDPQGDVEEAAAALVARGTQKVLVSRGRQGAYLATDSGSLGRAAFPAAVVNVTGAGDAMMAAAIDADLDDASDRTILERALAAAALTLSSTETIHPEMTKERLEEWQ